MIQYKKKIVKNYIDADKLIKEGFICKGIDRNICDKTQLVFWFDNSPKLIKRLKELLEEN